MHNQNICLSFIYFHDKQSLIYIKTFTFTVFKTFRNSWYTMFLFLFLFTRIPAYCYRRESLHPYIPHPRLQDSFAHHRRDVEQTHFCLPLRTCFCLVSLSEPKDRVKACSQGSRDEHNHSEYPIQQGQTLVSQGLLVLMG